MLEFEHNNPELKFKFRYQKDTNFQALIEHGIGYDLSDSGFCWAACIDMALSPYIPENIRSNLIIDSVKHKNLKNGVFNPRGELNAHRLDDFIKVLNESIGIKKLKPELNLIKNQKFEDYHLELQKGRTVIYGIDNNHKNGHMLVMEKVYQDGGKYIYSVWDPAISDPTKANNYIDNFELHARHQYTDTKLHAFIISVG